MGEMAKLLVSMSDITLTYYVSFPQQRPSSGGGGGSGGGRRRPTPPPKQESTDKGSMDNELMRKLLKRRGMQSAKGMQ